MNAHSQDMQVLKRSKKFSDSVLRVYDAVNELKRIYDKEIFKVEGFTDCKRWNGNTTQFTFPDSSCLLIKSISGTGEAWHPDWKGTANDIHLGPEKVSLKIGRGKNNELRKHGF